MFYEPLPGEWGVTPPMTIAAPVLVATKSGPATMNLGQWGDFAIDVQNIGLSDAWNATIRDLLPDGATGGMCDLTPEILSVQVFAADGVTPVPGKGPLTQGSGYSLSYSAAPNCRLDIRMLTAAGRIGPNERLIIRYRTQLDANTQNGVALTNVAGAIQWFNGDSSSTERMPYTRTLTNGTVGTLDHEDAHTVTVALTGYFFDKTVANLTTGAESRDDRRSGRQAALHVALAVHRSGAHAISGSSTTSDALNAGPAFVPGTLTLVTYPGRGRHQRYQQHGRHQRHRRPRHPQPERAGQRRGPDRVRHHPGFDLAQRHRRHQPVDGATRGQLVLRLER